MLLRTRSSPGCKVQSPESPPRLCGNLRGWEGKACIIVEHGCGKSLKDFPPHGRSTEYQMHLCAPLPRNVSQSQPNERHHQPAADHALSKWLPEPLSLERCTAYNGILIGRLCFAFTEMKAITVLCDHAIDRQCSR